LHGFFRLRGFSDIWLMTDFQLRATSEPLEISGTIEIVWGTAFDDQVKLKGQVDYSFGDHFVFTVGPENVELQVRSDAKEPIPETLLKSPTSRWDPRVWDRVLKDRVRPIAPNVVWVSDSYIEEERARIKAGISDAYWIESGGMVALFQGLESDSPRLEVMDPGEGFRAQWEGPARELFAKMLLGEYESLLVES